MNCQVTGRSKIVDTEIVSNIATNNLLILFPNNLTTNDFNDPNLGLYFNEGSAMEAEARCNAGTGSETSEALNLETGVAATFDCVQIETIDTLIVPSSKTLCSKVSVTEIKMTSSDGNDIDPTAHILSSSAEMTQTLSSLVVTVSTRSSLGSAGKVASTVAITSRVMFGQLDSGTTIVTVSLSVLGIIILIIIVIVLALFCVLQKRKKFAQSSR